MDHKDDTPFATIANFQKTIPVDVSAIARALGIPVTFSDLGTAVAGMLVQDHKRTSPSGYVVYVNTRDNPNRQRFTLAHEIAHYVLHRDLIEAQLIDDTVYRSSLGDAREAQANRLAADILMPIMIVKSRLNRIREASTAWFGPPSWENRPLVEELARQFAVSTSAMEIRLKGLKQTN